MWRMKSFAKRLNEVAVDLRDDRRRRALRKRGMLKRGR
jgi:hypothetical protein